MAFAPTQGHCPASSAQAETPAAPLAARDEHGRSDQGDPLIGTVLDGRYLLEQRLGEGAMGAVYSALHVTLGSQLAVKVLHQRHAGDHTVSQRFDREAEAEAQLDHPNCVQVVDAGVTESGTKYLVMPLLCGAELRSLIDGPMDAKRATNLVLQILEGLDHAHRRGFVHRDVKPENVFVVHGEGGEELAKLVDFGLVKALRIDDSRPVLTEVGKVFGTPWYMSPEQAVGNGIDARSDLYAVGVMLFEMLTGAPPFHADSFAVLLRKHLLADPPRLPAHVPSALATVVYRLLEKEPGARFESARVAAEALRAAMDDETRHIAPSASFAGSGALSLLDVSGSSFAAGSGAAPFLEPSCSGSWVLPTTFDDELSDSRLRQPAMRGTTRGTMRWLAAGLAAAALLVFGVAVAVQGRSDAALPAAEQGLQPAEPVHAAPSPAASVRTGLVADAGPTAAPAVEPRAALPPEPAPDTKPALTSAPAGPTRSAPSRTRPTVSRRPTPPVRSNARTRPPRSSALQPPRQPTSKLPTVVESPTPRLSPRRPPRAS